MDAGRRAGVTALPFSSTDGHVRSRDGAHTRREKPCDRTGPPARSRGHLPRLNVRQEASG